MKCIKCIKIIYYTKKYICVYKTYFFIFLIPVFLNKCNMLNYVIFAPPLSASAGIRALYRLSEELEKRGFSAPVLCLESSPGYHCINTFTKEMQENDIITHIYSGFPNTILDERGKVRRAIWDARDRGVKFDIGHAGKHFSWDVFQRAYGEGLKFDYMGGDLGYGNYRNENFPIYDQFHAISGFLNAGVPLDEMFRTVISNPQAYLGTAADLNGCCLILKRYNGETAAGDGLKKFIPCKYEYRPSYFINQGRLFYNSEL